LYGSLDFRTLSRKQPLKQCPGHEKKDHTVLSGLLWLKTMSFPQAAFFNLLVSLTFKFFSHCENSVPTSKEGSIP